MDKSFHPTLYRAYDYLCMLGLKEFVGSLPGASCLTALISCHGNIKGHTSINIGITGTPTATTKNAHWILRPTETLIDWLDAYFLCWRKRAFNFLFVSLTHWGLVMHILISQLSRHWFRYWLVPCSTLSHYITWTNADILSTGLIGSYIIKNHLKLDNLHSSKCWKAG